MEGTAAHAQYVAEAYKRPGKEIGVPGFKNINFCKTALAFLQQLYHHHSDDPLFSVLRTSKYSLRALHILAFGVRGAMVAAVGHRPTIRALPLYRRSMNTFHTTSYKFKFSLCRSRIVLEHKILFIHRLFFGRLWITIQCRTYWFIHQNSAFESTIIASTRFVSLCAYRPTFAVAYFFNKPSQSIATSTELSTCSNLTLDSLRKPPRLQHFHHKRVNCIGVILQVSY